jgi:arogenate/prephenate dehydratase
MRVAFQGVHGAYSEVAARTMLGPSITTLPCRSFDDVFRAVERGRADRGVLPIENSLSGSIHRNYDLLLAHRLHIVGETHLRVEHVLMCHPSSSLRKLTVVRSHPQALAQCGAFFARTKRLHPEPFFDTAGAAESIMRERKLDTGAIASSYAASLYGLRVIRRNIEDLPNNFTRFLLLSRTPWKPVRGYSVKCSISFKPARNQVGSLFRILGVFALRDIDLLKIESRPDRETSFNYLFYVDFAGNPNERHVTKALEHLQEVTRNYRLLGAYPAERRSHTRSSRRER